jgi:colanic acid biosynthesis glycosyl transferase WcaI
LKILFIKQLFDPEPTAKSLDLALELKKRGHEVQVLTGFPSYPLGKIYEGYKQRLWQKEEQQGIEIIRVPIYPNHTRSGLKRAIYYISYAVTASLIGLFLVRKPDVAFVYQGAIPVAVPAILYKWFRNVPFVYDINDMWPETVADSGMSNNRRVLKFIEKWCRVNYKQAKRITVLSDGFRENLIRKGIPGEKISVVNNWNRDVVTQDHLERKTMESVFPEHKVNILYAGTLGPMQSLQTILLAAERLLSNPRVNFIFIGTGNDEENLKRMAAEKKLTNVTFLPRVSKERISAYINAADILVVHLKYTRLFEITIPSKIFSCMMHAKPILLGLKGDGAKIISRARCGIVFEPEKVDSLMEAINTLSTMTDDERKLLGENGKKYYMEHFSIEKATDKLEKVFMESIA